MSFTKGSVSVAEKGAMFFGTLYGGGGARLRMRGSVTEYTR